MASTRGLWLSLLLGTSLSAGVAFADVAEPAEEAEEVAQVAPQPLVLLSPISVTATRNPVDAFHYPGMVSVVDREDIRREQASTIDDVVGRLPGVSFLGGPRRSGQVPSIRGFSGPDVVLLIDGVRQNFNSGHDGRLFLEPSLLRGAEVLRGSASSLYGSGGLGGVMEFRTLRAEDVLAPDESYGLENSFGYGSARDEVVWTTTGVARPVENLDLVGSVTKRNSGTIRLGDGTRLRDTNDDILSGLVKGGLSFQDYHRLEASALFFNNDAEEPNNPQGDGPDVVDKEIRNRTYRLSYEYDNPTDQWLNLNATLYHAQNEVTETRLDDLGAGPRGEELQRDVNTLGFRLENRSSFVLSDASSVRFTYGMEANRDEQDGRSPGVPDGDATLYGAFAQAELEWAEPFGVLPGNLQVIPGVRFDRYRSSGEVAGSNSDSALSPRLAASYSPTDWGMLFASYGEAFRAPTFDELYPSGTHFQIPIGPATIVNRFVPNPDLKPQRSRTFEIGAGLNFQEILDESDSLHLKAARYWTRAKDFIDLEVNQPAPFVDCIPFIPGNCDGTTQAVNVARAKLSGNEVEAVYDHSRFRLALGYADIDGRNDETGDYLGVLFPPRVTADATLRIPEIDSFLGWRVTHAKRFTKTDDEAEERDAYTTHDLYFGWAPSDGLLTGLRIDLGVDNVTDKTYARAYAGANEPGRNFKGLVSYRLTW